MKKLGILFATILMMMLFAMSVSAIEIVKTGNCGDDGDHLVFSIIVDGSFNAPARVIATRRVHKNELHLLKKAKLRKLATDKR